MRVRALDSNNDWTFGRGQNDYLQRNRAIGQNIQTRLASFLGDCYFDTRAGIDWFNLLGGKDLIALNLAINAVILNTEGVSSIIEISIDLDRSTRKVVIVYSVTTIYSGLTSPSSVVQGTADFLVTEDGDIITTEDGDPLVVGD